MSRIFKFGLFEVNPATRELLREGRRVRLQEQPFRMLLLMLETPGQVITRERLREQLWSGDTFVEFDSSLRVAVGKLRDALGDDADNPRFVATIPRIGYRFVAPVEVSELPETVARPVPSAAPKSPEINSSAQPRRQGSWIWRAAIVIVLAAVGALVISRRPRAAYALRQADTVLLAEFVNKSGDAAFDDTLRQGLAIGLAQSPYISVLPDRQAVETLQLMGYAPNKALNGAVAMEACQRTGSKAVLSGSIASFGTQYVISLAASSCQTGAVFAQDQVQASRKEDVLKVLGEATTQIRERIGESLASIQKFDVPLEQATTPSLEALKAYSLGMKVRNVNGAADSIPYLKHAIELDPNFALAYGSLSSAYQLLGEDGLGQEYAKKAYGLRDRVTEREKFAVTGYYYNFVTGEREKALQNCKVWADAYPQDMTPRMCLFFVSEMLGRYEQALPMGLQCVAVDQSTGACYADLIYSYTVLNRLEDAKAIYKQAIAHGLDYPDLHSARYGIAFLEGDSGEMARQMEWAAHNPRNENGLLFAQSETEAYYGHFLKAHELSDRAIKSAVRNDQPEAAARWQIAAALREAMIGDRDGAVRLEAAAREHSSFEYLNSVAAVTEACVGNSSGAQKLYDSLDKAYPSDTMLQAFWLPTVRAGIELSRKRPASAIDALGPAAPFEMGEHIPLLPAYVRGQAYLAAGDGTRAAVEFQKLIEHRGLIQNSLMGPLSELGLARAYVLQSDKAQGGLAAVTRDKARLAYRAFLDLWKNADPDLPMLQKVRAESAQLQ
jgi:eukaryotic-like serine/threonine-protein kinase